MIDEIEKLDIVAVYRIKNEERWIAKSLESASEICTKIVILDDGSTDNTIKICKSFNKVIKIHEQRGLPFDEVRDKNILLRMALDLKPGFILSLDGDEIIQPHASDLLFEDLSILYPDVSLFEFQSLFIWDKPNQFRCDGVYGSIWYKRLMRMYGQSGDLHYENTKYPGNAHSTRLPQNAKDWNNPIRGKIKIFHYGYYDEPMRRQKYEFYNHLDPKNTDFDGYVHILGKGKFSGPDGIKIKTIPDEVFMPIT